MPDKSQPSARTVPAVLLAARFLFPLDEHRHDGDRNWRNAGRWFVFWGVVIGVAYAVLFRVAWRWFGEYQDLRLLPAAVVLTADLGWCGYRLLAAASRFAGRQDSHSADSPPPVNLPTLLAVILIAIVKYALLLSLPRGAEREQWDSLASGSLDGADWRVKLGICYPLVLYRPLILMPLWGRWAMTLAMSVGRVSAAGSARLQRMADGTRLPMVIAQWLACAALTVLYCSGSGEHVARGIVIALGMMVLAYLVSFVLARRAGGQTEATVGVVALAAEIGFLLLYLPITGVIYWY